MATIDRSQLEAFVTVVRAGSFTAAADVLGTRKSHLSRVIARMEERLGARLITRTTRSLKPTEIGRDVFARAVAILEAMDATEAVVSRALGVPSGTLRITCGAEFGVLVVTRWVSAYLGRHPDVRVEADYTNRVVDIVHEGFDVAVRVGALADSSLSARRLGAVTFALFASPSYLAGADAIVRIEDLARHAHVAFAPGGARAWRLSHGGREVAVPLSPRLVVNNNMAARDAAADGIGIALLPEFQARDHVRAGRLVPVLPGWTREPAPVHAVFASARYMAPKVRAFVDLAVETFAASVSATDAAAPLTPAPPPPSP